MIAFISRDILNVNFIVGLLFKFSLLYFCSFPKEASKFQFCLMLRKMSIIIYFTHFVLVIIWRTMVNTGRMSYEFGFREFFVVLLLTLIASYIIIKLSSKIKILRYLY